MKATSILLAAFLAAAPFTVSMADDATPPAATPPGPGGHHMDPAKMQQKFGLSNDQVTKLQAVMAAQKTAMEPLWSKQKDLMKTLSDQVAKKASDADIKTTLASLQTNREAMRTQAQQFRTQKQAILTPTQQAQMLLARMDHFKGRMHRGMRPQGAPPEDPQNDGTPS